MQRTFHDQISPDSLEETLINQARQLAKDNVSGVAKILGTTRSRVAYRLSGRKLPTPPEDKA